MIVQKCLKPFTLCQSALLRSMSMWTPGFEDPILHKNELKNAKVSGTPNIFYKQLFKVNYKEYASSLQFYGL